MELKTAVDIGQLIAALAAAGGLFVASRSLRSASRSSDAATLQEWSLRLANADRIFSSSLATENFQREFNARLNLLEVIAATVNHALVGRVTKAQLVAVLKRDLATISGNPGALGLLEKAIDGPDTFEEIKKFYRANRNSIGVLVSTRPD